LPVPPPEDRRWLLLINTVFKPLANDANNASCPASVFFAR
jgi:hypothetical protein